MKRGNSLLFGRTAIKLRESANRLLFPFIQVLNRSSDEFYLFGIDLPTTVSGHLWQGFWILVSDFRPRSQPIPQYILRDYTEPGTNLPPQDLQVRSSV